MAHPNRTRQHSICIRMNDAEYEALQKRMQESGQTMQSCIINAVLENPLIPEDGVAELRQINRKLEEATSLYRGTATNLNQLARTTNLLVKILHDDRPNIDRMNSLAASLPDPMFVETLAKYVLQYRKDIETIWQSLRSLLGQQKHTQA